MTPTTSSAVPAQAGSGAPPSAMLTSPVLMGIINVTPDSFSDGGRWLDEGRAVAHGQQLARDGAGILDVGGESTRPGAQRLDEADEMSRTIPVVRRLAADPGLAVTISIDTMRAGVAEAAIESARTGQSQHL